MDIIILKFLIACAPLATCVILTIAVIRRYQ